MFMQIKNMLRLAARKLGLAAFPDGVPNGAPHQSYIEQETMELVAECERLGWGNINMLIAGH